MKINVDLVFLGAEQKESKKTGATYFLAKLMNTADSQIYDFYIAGSNQMLITDLVKLQPLTPNKFVLKISSYQGKAQVDLEGLAK